MSMFRRTSAEFLGTFWLVFGGCGSAVLSAAFPEVGIGLTGVSLAFGLTVLTMAYSVGHISGCHLNPAVTVGLWAGGRFPAQDIPPYVHAPVLGAFPAAAGLRVVPPAQAHAPPAANGPAPDRDGGHSPGPVHPGC
ncbi:aquaporin, partial [Azospirillum brasilense]|uniref:aquaporin n=1 Tax=Azospirillum argentinense TaxID=2970906 RepID=UPI00190EACCB